MWWWWCSCSHVYDGNFVIMTLVMLAHVFDCSITTYLVRLERVRAADISRLLRQRSAARVHAWRHVNLKKKLDDFFLK